MAKEPRYIAGIINQYHFNRRARDQGTAISKIQTVYAKRHWFSGTWSVHELTINTGMPATRFTRFDRSQLVAAVREFTPGAFSIANRSHLTGKIGNHREIQSNLTLKQAFDLVRANEESPQPLVFQTSSPGISKSLVNTGVLDVDGKAALKQVQPETTFYWRNLNPA